MANDIDGAEIMQVKVTVDFLVVGVLPEEAKSKIDRMLRHTIVPTYNVRPQTEVISLEGD
jgi:hypothetical protein